MDGKITLLTPFSKTKTDANVQFPSKSFVVDKDKRSAMLHSWLSAHSSHPAIAALLLRGYRKKDVSSHGQTFSPIRILENVDCDDFVRTGVDHPAGTDQVLTNTAKVSGEHHKSARSTSPCFQKHDSSSEKSLASKRDTTTASSKQGSTDSDNLQTPPEEMHEIEEQEDNGAPASTSASAEDAKQPEPESAEAVMRVLTPTSFLGEFDFSYDSFESSNESTLVSFGAL
jgi:hypothetical protein